MKAIAFQTQSSWVIASDTPFYLGYVVLGVSLLLVIVAPVQSTPVLSKADAVKYLSRYGYLPSSARNFKNGGLPSDNVWSNALMDFQSFVGLKATGILDNETMQAMSLPRCATPDIFNFDRVSRAKRYVLSEGILMPTHITYKILNYPTYTEMSKEEISRDIFEAFNAYSKYTNLTFTETNDARATLTLFFQNKDGMGKVLAEASFPADKTFKIWYDDLEYWIKRGSSSEGTILFAVSLHEIGHALGLMHSGVKGSVMFPIYNKTVNALQDDDIRGIQNLYGPKEYSPN